jgi:hypothetical protein
LQHSHDPASPDRVIRSHTTSMDPRRRTSPYKSSALPRQDDLLVTTHSPSSAHTATCASQACVASTCPLQLTKLIACLNSLIAPSSNAYLSTPDARYLLRKQYHTYQAQPSYCTRCEAVSLEICLRVGTRLYAQRNLRKRVGAGHAGRFFP